MGGYAGISYDLRGARPDEYKRFNDALKEQAFKPTGVDTVWTIALGDLAQVEKRFMEAVGKARVVVEKAVILPMSDPVVKIIDLGRNARQSLADAIRDQFSHGLRGDG